MRKAVWRGACAHRVVALSVVGALMLAASGASAQGPSPSPTFERPRTQPPLEQFLDMGFGTDGRATTTGFGGERSAMALQPDGSVVLVGGTFVDFVMARFLADGTLDPGFGTDGTVTTDIAPNQQEEALAVALAPDGGIVVAGYTGFDATLALARYLPDGSLDAAFGAGGIVSGVVPGRAFSVAVQPDGRIVVGGIREDQASSTDFGDLLVVRFLPDGSLDPDFGEDGQVAVDVGDATNTGRELAVLDDGDILVSGEPFGTFEGSERTDLVRLDADGALDPGFGIDGVLALEGARVGEGLAVQPDGVIVLAGRALTGTQTQFEVRRLTSDGAPDTSFGDGGVVRTDMRDNTEAALDVAVDAEGRIVAVGRAGDFNTDFAFARYLPDGTLDPAFADVGVLYVDFFLLPDFAESVAIQPDGMIVTSGLVQQDTDGYGVTRVLP